MRIARVGLLSASTGIMRGVWIKRAQTIQVTSVNIRTIPAKRGFVHAHLELVALGARKNRAGTMELIFRYSPMLAVLHGRITAL